MNSFPLYHLICHHSLGYTHVYCVLDLQDILFSTCVNFWDETERDCVGVVTSSQKKHVTICFFTVKIPPISPQKGTRCIFFFFSFSFLLRFFPPPTSAIYNIYRNTSICCVQSSHDMYQL